MFLLIVFAIKELMDIVFADVYFEEEFVYSETVEIGGGSHRVEITDYCVVDDTFYFVGSAVRLGNYKGGRDGVLIQFKDGDYNITSFGGFRDDFFLGMYCSDDLYIVGNTYSTDFLGRSPNFLTGFYLQMSYEGKLNSSYQLPYKLDIYPTSIWIDNGVKIAGYLDNFGNKDVFIYDERIEVIEHTGVDKIYSVENGIGYGSTTSKEFGALSVNPAVYDFRKKTFDVYPSIHRGELFSRNRGYLSDKGVTFDGAFKVVDEIPPVVEDVIKVTVDEAMVITREFEVQFSYDEPFITHEVELMDGVYTYDEYQLNGYTVFTNLQEKYKFTHNIERETYYNAFNLLFTGSGVLNGEEIVTGITLGLGDYTFEWNGEIVDFSVKSNDTEFQFISGKEVFIYEENDINKKLILIPIIVVGNLLYKKYK